MTRPHRPHKGHRGRDGTRNRERIGVAAHETLVLGRNAVREVVRFSPERIVRIFVAEGAGSEKDEIAALTAEHGLEVESRPYDELSRLAGTDSHQGVVAVATERERPDLPSFISGLNDKPQACVLVLDEINDPQNLGAILRAAECFGVEGVVISRNRGVGVTPVVTKASAGASELVTVVPVANVADAVRKLKEGEFWVVAADSVEGGDSLDTFDFPQRTAIIMGSEGRGVQRLLRDLSDFRVRIPMVGRVDSLNVGQATAVFLSRYRALFRSA